MGLQEAAAFLRGAAARNLHGGAPSLYCFSGGWARASGANSVAAASYPVPLLQGDFSLDADNLDAALRRLGGEPAVSAGDGTLVLRLGRRRHEVDLLDPVDLPDPAPGSWSPLPDGLVAALSTAAGFAADEGTWQTGVAVSDHVAAFNGRSAVEVTVPGLSVPLAVLPAEGVRYVASQDEAPVEWSLGPSAAFRWASGAAVALRLVSGEWPETVAVAVAAGSEDAPVPVDEALREGVADAAALGDGTVRVRPQGVAGGRLGLRAALEFECAATRETEWNLKALAPVVAVADRWDPDAASGVARFYGPNLRGVVAAIRR